MSGYNLDELLPEKGFNVARALTGTEGTCVTVLRSMLLLTPSLDMRTLVAVGYPQLADAAEHAMEIIEQWRPIGLEALDEQLIAEQQQQHVHTDDIEELPKAGSRAWLLVQFGADTADESEGTARRFAEWLTSQKGYPAERVVVAESEQEGGWSQDIWEIREGGLGATAFARGEDNWPGWEDSAVPPDKLGGYVRDLRALMNSHGIKGAMYGHFGQGCIHCRLSFDLRTAAGIANYRGFLEEAADLVISYGGSLVSGDLSSLTTWRAAFWWLAVPSLVLAWLVWRLPEPVRGGASRIAAGATEIPAERENRVAGDQDTRTDTGHQERDPGGREAGLVRQAVGRSGASPREDLILREDPAGRPLWWAVRYVLRVRTNVVIIIASALGYFYFAGLRSFAIIFATGHYGISKPTATFLILVIGGGALVGVFVGGRVADRLLHRGHLSARVILPAASLLVLPFVLAPAIATGSVAVALPLLIAGAFLLGAPNPALDAARLDIMPSGLWGRAEAVRTLLRSGGEAAAPLLFGYVSQYVFGGPGSASGGDGSSGAAAGNAAGLEYTFLLFLGALLIAGLLALAGLRTYPRDVATAAASAEAIGQAARNSGRQCATSMAQCPDRGGNRRSAAERLSSRRRCTSGR